MDSTRRNFLAGIGIAGADLPAQSASAIGVDEVIYRYPSPKSVARTLANRLIESLSVLDFGAKGDGVADDTSAIQAAADAAAANGKVLHIPSMPRGYLVTDTIELRVRRVVGECNFVDSKNSGTLINYKPTAIADMKPCFSVVGGMYGGGLVENLSIFGPETYPLGQLGDHIDAKRLPNYSAFAPGVSAFGVFGNNQPIFRNVSTNGVKVGLYLDSTDGHVSSYDCNWRGLFGVYCHRNSEDYFFMGGSISGSWSGLVFGTFPWAGHNGGMHISSYRVHWGFSPFGVYQVNDSNYTGQVLSLYGRLDAVRFERIGEAILSFLPQSVTDSLAIDAFGFSWSPIYRRYPEEPNGWNTNLPPEILPYDDQQQYAMRFGYLTGAPKLGWLGDSWPIRRSTNAKKTGGIAIMERLNVTNDANLAAFNGDYVAKITSTNLQIGTGEELDVSIANGLSKTEKLPSINLAKPAGFYPLNIDGVKRWLPYY